MSTIAFFEVEKWAQDVVKARFKAHNLLFFRGPISPATMKKAAKADILVVFIYSKVTKKVLDALPNLKLIATMSTGFDHIDLQECAHRRIRVANVPFYGENTVAEHTFALLLSLSRKIPQSIEHTRRGNFSPEGLRGFDLKAKTLGVIGTGSIGRHVIRMARGFDMNVLAFDVNKDAKAAKQLGFRYVSLDALLRKSDIVTLHVPYNKHTHHLIDDAAVKKMKRGAFLINTARGGLVDNTALLKGLNSRQLAGAALDVLEEEGAIKEEAQLLSKKVTADLMAVLEGHMLLNHPRVLITPHNAFNSEEAVRRILDTTLENIAAFQKKRKLNVVS